MKKTSARSRGTENPGGRISAEAVKLVERQVTDRGIVVWYDPQKVYHGLAARLDLPGVQVLRYEDGFFRLREQLEPLLECVTEDGRIRDDADSPPQAVLYVPLDRQETGYALIEAETAGAVVEPCAGNPDCDSRIGRIVECVFKSVAPAKAQHLARQADEGLLTLEELDRMAEEASGAAAGTLQAIFGHVSAEEILLQFVSGDSYDEKITARAALPELLGLAQSELSLPEPPGADAAACRLALGRYALVTELFESIPELHRPEGLAGLVCAGTPAQRDSVVHLCRSWRNRLDLEESYLAAADAIEKQLNLQDLRLPPEALPDGETFAFLDRLWMSRAIDRCVQWDAQAVLETARKRASGFWPRKRPELQLGWRVLESAAELALAAPQVEKTLRQRSWSLDEIVEAYALHAEPWLRLDRLARELETRYARWEAALTGVDTLEPVMVVARERFLSVSALLAEAYARALQEADFASSRFESHVEVFRRAVSPAIQSGSRTAFFMVDALRYEMAVELLEGFERDFEIDLRPVLGRLPGITPVGMAALLPRAEDGLSLDRGSDGTEVAIAGHRIGSRGARLDWLASNAGAACCIAKLGDVLKASFKRRKEFGSAQLIVVTSQEIDLLGEGGDEENVRLYLQDVLDRLRRALRVLAKAGIERFVIATDHGFLFAPGVDPGLRMDPPGGQTAELHPRVWIGEGGTSGPGYFRVRASDLALGGPFELAFPLGLANFKVKGGAGAYMHGGISPAEHILPLCSLTARKTAPPAGVSRVRLSIARPVVTNRLFSVTVELSGEGLFPQTERRVRFEVLSGQKEVGQAATAAYGFSDGTREVQVRAGSPDVVTLMLTATEVPQSITVRVLDCETQVVLDALKDLPVQLAI